MNSNQPAEPATSKKPIKSANAMTQWMNVFLRFPSLRNQFILRSQPKNKIHYHKHEHHKYEHEVAKKQVDEQNSKDNSCQGVGWDNLPTVSIDWSGYLAFHLLHAFFAFVSNQLNTTLRRVLNCIGSLRSGPLFYLNEGLQSPRCVSSGSAHRMVVMPDPAIRDQRGERRLRAQDVKCCATL